MTKYEKFGLNAVARLVDPITSGATTLVVTTVDRFPTDGNFRITIGQEILLVTALSGTTFTVVRGYESSTALAHDAGTPVQQTITAGALERAMLDSVPLARDLARPQLNTLVDASGNTLTSSDFNWVNQGTASVSDLTSGGISLLAPANVATRSMRIRLKPTAITAPHVLTVAFVPHLHGASDCRVGVGVMVNATGRTVHIATGKVDEIEVIEMVNATTLASSPVATQPWFMGRGIQWFQIEDDNTDIFYRTSMDGVNWQEVYQHARAALMSTTAPDRRFWFVDSRSTTLDSAGVLLAWEES